jgi:hypothetical protein
MRFKQIWEQLIIYLKIIFWGNANVDTYSIVKQFNKENNDQLLGCKNYWEITFDDLNIKYQNNKKMIFDPTAVIAYDYCYDYNDNVCEQLDAEILEKVHKSYSKFTAFLWITYFKSIFKYLDAKAPEFYISKEERLSTFIKFKIKEYIIIISYFFILFIIFYNWEISKSKYLLDYEYYNFDLGKYTNIKIPNYQYFYAEIIFNVLFLFIPGYLWANIILDNIEYGRKYRRSKIRIERMKKDPSYRYRRKGDPYEEKISSDLVFKQRPFEHLL